MTWHATSSQTKRMQWRLVLALAVVLLVALAVAWFIVTDRSPTVETTPITNEQSEVTTETVPPEPDFDKIAIDATVQEWAAEQTGNSSVVIADSEGTILSQVDPDRIYFAASLYKLYVAYAGYQSIDDGTYDRDDGIILNTTRWECLVKMIRDSDSPCGEAWWVELGKPELTEQMSNLGLGFTNMSAITTSASDAAKLLVLVANGEGLSDGSQAAYLDAMKTQDALYRRGLPSGFSDSITVYNKVGWNENIEWHDAAIVETTKGRRLIIAVLTENVGTTAIKNLATRLEPIIDN